MSHPEIFEQTLHKSRAWVQEMEQRLQCDSHTAYAALRAGLHVLRDHLPTQEAVDLAAQLPMLIRGMYFDGWRPGAHRPRARHLEDYAAEVAKHVPPSSTFTPEDVLDATMRLLSRHIGRGEITDVIACLPREIGEIWS